MKVPESEPVFLSVDEVLALHGDQIRLYGGSLGVRDMRALEWPSPGIRDKNLKRMGPEDTLSL